MKYLSIRSACATVAAALLLGGCVVADQPGATTAPTTQAIEQTVDQPASSDPAVPIETAVAPGTPDEAVALQEPPAPDAPATPDATDAPAAPDPVPPLTEPEIVPAPPIVQPDPAPAPVRAPAPRPNRNRGRAISHTVQILPVNLNDPVRPVVLDGAIRLHSAKNEWTSFTVRLDGMSQSVLQRGTLLVDTPVGPDGALIEASRWKAYQVLAMPVDVNRAGYVRHTGLSAAVRRLPRALLPMAMNNGEAPLGRLRNPANPLEPGALSADGESPTLWIDLQVPPETPAGIYTTTIEVLNDNRQVVGQQQIQIEVDDFVLAGDRHLAMVGRVPWETLVAHYPDRFEAITPRLMNRNDDRYTPAIRTIDQLVTIAHEHRLAVVVPRLQPTVKWPPNAAPQFDWRDFDSVVAPWLTGEMFIDRTPLPWWPLPAVDYLANFDPRSRSQYWSAVATHFDQREWLRRSAAFVEKVTPGRATVTEALQVSADARQILAAHPRLQLVLPIETDQLALQRKPNEALIDPRTGGRIVAAAPGLVSVPPSGDWPEDMPRPQRWLRTDLQGLVPYVGAGGDERDIRLWAWLAFLRQASMILWQGVLPDYTDPHQPADPSDMVWFYPGHWFGVDEPVPTVQLKWLRRAEQDYEYLYLARQRGQLIDALVMARLITKPVEIQPNQSLDPTYALMCGTTNIDAWNHAKELIARTILLHGPGETVDQARANELALETIRWMEPQERPTLLGRTLRWGWGVSRENVGNWADLRIGVDIYNASDAKPANNTVEYSAVPTGWQVQPQPVEVPTLSTYHVTRVEVNGAFNLEQAQPGKREPVRLTYTDGYSMARTVLEMMIPVAPANRREGGLAIDGSLNDWIGADSIQEGPLVKMFDRPSVQGEGIAYAQHPTRIFTRWADQHLYVAFEIEGVSPEAGPRGQNFARYQFRRAWEEDLCQVMVQGIGRNNSAGPLLHLVCKPTGALWVERKLDPKLHVDPWQPYEGSGVRFSTTVDDAGIWRGEVAIPWKVLADTSEPLPQLLRFNFAQHLNATGESATWAGPVDYGRDDGFMGLLYLRTPDDPGMRR